MSASDATSVVAAAAPAAPFTTSFLRDGATGKSYAIIHFNESNSTINFTVYERQSATAIGTSAVTGSSNNSTGATIVFPISKGSTYFVIATTPSGESLSWTVDPNKRRVGSGVSGGAKKRTAEGEPVAAAKDEAAAAAPAPAVAAAPAVAGGAAAAAPKEKKETKEKAAPKDTKEPKEKKSKATA